VDDCSILPLHATVCFALLFNVISCALPFQGIDFALPVRKGIVL